MALAQKITKNIVGENPEYSILKIYSPVFKQGIFEFQLESKLIDFAMALGVNVKVTVPREYLVGNPKAGKKLGSYQIQEPPKGKIGKIPVLKTMFSSFATIDLFVAK